MFPFSLSEFCIVDSNNLIFRFQTHVNNSTYIGLYVYNDILYVVQYILRSLFGVKHSYYIGPSHKSLRIFRQLTNRQASLWRLVLNFTEHETYNVICIPRSMLPGFGNVGLDKASQNNII